jgi:ribosomal protein L29
VTPEGDRAAPSPARDSAGSKVGAGAAGAGIGTLLILLANNLTNNNPWKSWLVIVAPSASVAVSAGYAWLRVALDDYLDKRELRRIIAQARQTLQEALGNSNTSESHKVQLRKELEKLEILLVKTDIARIRTLTRSHISVDAGPG